MSEVTEFFKGILQFSDWPARWHCGRWSEFHGWLYITSDLLIWAAYFTIPIILLRFIKLKRDIPFPTVFWMFGAFIFACGSTHLIDALMFWVPLYRLSAMVRFFTALISWGTVYMLYRIMPLALQLKSPDELERVVKQRTQELTTTVSKLQFLADAMPQIVWMAGPDGGRTYTNQLSLEYTGCTEEALLGWNWPAIIHPDDRPTYMERWQRALNTGGMFECEMRLANRDGHYYWHLSRALPHLDRDGQIIMWVGTSTQIDNQKKASETLERMVAERTSQLEELNLQLSESNNNLQQFAAIASHDLQSPLRTVNAYLDLLLHKNEAVLDDRSKELIATASRATMRMKRLIENLLVLGKGDTEWTRSTADLNALLKEVLQNLETVVQEKKARVNIGKLPTLAVNAPLMSQVFQNLILNGIKYNDSEVPEVSVNYVAEPGTHVFKVSDNGVGISADYQAKIFEPFTRLQSDKQGTGLGLAICKKIVEKHGGRIWVESRPQGTTFAFSIPAEEHTDA